MILRVAGLQMPVTEDIPVNTRRIIAGLERAAAEGAEILLTPEGALSGYRPDFSVPEVTTALERVAAVARGLGVGMALGTCYRETDGHCYNQLRFYRADGTYLGFHSKTLLCAAIPRRPADEINHYAVRPLQVFEWTPGCVVGGLICNDLWANPQWTPMPDCHLTQQLAEMGARVIFHAVNGGRDGSETARVNRAYHESNLRLRAAAGEVWIVTTDNAAPPHLPCSSPGGVIDPSGAWACEAPVCGEHLFVHALDLARGGGRHILP